MGGKECRLSGGPRQQEASGQLVQTALAPTPHQMPARAWGVVATGTVARGDTGTAGGCGTGAAGGCGSSAGGSSGTTSGGSSMVAGAVMGAGAGATTTMSGTTPADHTVRGGTGSWLLAAALQRARQTRTLAHPPTWVRGRRRHLAQAGVAAVGQQGGRGGHTRQVGPAVRAVEAARQLLCGAQLGARQAGGARRLNQAAPLLLEHRAQLAAGGEAQGVGRGVGVRLGCGRPLVAGRRSVVQPCRSRRRCPDVAPQQLHTQSRVLLLAAALLRGQALRGVPRARQRAEGACRAEEGVGTGWLFRQPYVQQAITCRRLPSLLPTCGARQALLAAGAAVCPRLAGAAGGAAQGGRCAARGAGLAGGGAGTKCIGAGTAGGAGERAIGAAAGIGAGLADGGAGGVSSTGQHCTQNIQHLLHRNLWVGWPWVGGSACGVRAPCPALHPAAHCTPPCSQPSPPHPSPPASPAASSRPGARAAASRVAPARQRRAKT